MLHYTIQYTALYNTIYCTIHYYILHNILLYNAPYKIYTAVYITIYCNIHFVMCCRLFTEERRILFDQVEQYIPKYGCQSNKM